MGTEIEREREKERDLCVYECGSLIETGESGYFVPFLSFFICAFHSFLSLCFPEREKNSGFEKWNKNKFALPPPPSMLFYSLFLLQVRRRQQQQGNQIRGGTGRPDSSFVINQSSKKPLLLPKREIRHFHFPTRSPIIEANHQRSDLLLLSKRAVYYLFTLLEGPSDSAPINRTRTFSRRAYGLFLKLAAC